VTTVPIPEISERILDAELAEEKDERGASIAELGRQLLAMANWKLRQKMMLDLAARVEKALLRGGPDDEATFAQILPRYVGSVLESMAETRMTCAEQAAWYSLSAHPEHQDAAAEWASASPSNLAAYRRYGRENMRFRRIFRRLVKAEEGEA
jgi:hypothetical protein